MQGILNHFDFFLLDSEATGLARLHASDSSSRCLPYHRFLVCHSDWSKLAPAQWMAACIGHPTTRFYNSNLFDKHIERFPVLCWLALLRFLILKPLRLMFIFQAKIIGHYAPRLAMWMDVNGAMLQCWFCCAWWNGLRCHHVSQQIHNTWMTLDDNILLILTININTLITWHFLIAVRSSMRFATAVPLMSPLAEGCQQIDDHS